MPENPSCVAKPSSRKLAKQEAIIPKTLGNTNPYKPMYIPNVHFNFPLILPSGSHISS